MSFLTQYWLISSPAMYPDDFVWPTRSLMTPWEFNSFQEAERAKRLDRWSLVLSVMSILTVVIVNSIFICWHFGWLHLLVTQFHFYSLYALLVGVSKNICCKYVFIFGWSIITLNLGRPRLWYEAIMYSQAKLWQRFDWLQNLLTSPGKWMT